MILRWLALLWLVSVAVGHAATDREQEARQLFARATERLAMRTIDMRRLAIADLERATELSPRRADILIELARAYTEAGFHKQSRLRYERAMALAEDHPEVRLGLARAWRRDYLKYLDPRSLERAIEQYTACVRLDESRLDAWLQLSALEVEQGDMLAARNAAERALAADPGRPEALLANASARWRLGEVERADTLFRTAIARLRRSVRERFEDFAPLATERDTAVWRRLSPAGRQEYVRQFWREHDPDLATSENEAQLEYWARCTQAYFLYFDPAGRAWDERGEVYVRYGRPDEALFNPVGTTLYNFTGLGGQYRYPVNFLVWIYTKLGMTVIMNDRRLTEYYELPVSMEMDIDPRPDPRVLESGALVTTPGARGVFPALPPRAEPLDVSSQLARFESPDGGARLFAGLSAPGRPADSLRAEFIVLDSTYHEVRRQARSLSPSACEPGEVRVADFDAGLPPGRYTVGLSARAGQRRGATRHRLVVEPVDSVFSMSDVVVTCGVPPGPQATVRLDANPSGRVPPGAPLVAYFEVYHLERGADGEGRFEYETSVHAARDERIWLQRLFSPRSPTADLGFTRQDKVLGTVRRQYVSVPVQSLLPGRYRLDVVVRDVLSGEERRRSVEFRLD